MEQKYGEHTIAAVDRFRDPLYTIAEAAQYLDVPVSTFNAWVRGYIRELPARPNVVVAPIVTSVAAPDGKSRRNEPTVPFVGLAEGLVLAAIRRQGVPLQRIRPTLKILADQIGLAHALASRKLYTDGAEVLYDYAEHARDSQVAHTAMQLIVIRNGQGVFNDVVAAALHRITYGPDGYAQVIRLPQYTKANIVADPMRSFGKPIFSHGGARVSDALHLFWAGEDLSSVAVEYGVPEVELQDAIRGASRRAA